MRAANEITPRRETHIKRLPLVEEMSHFVESNLRRILKSYADYYNRTHRSLNKDTPVFRPGLGFIHKGARGLPWRRLSIFQKPSLFPSPIAIP
jgi:hypothetical protein